MITLLVLWLIALSVVVAMAAVNLYDYCQQLESRVFMLEQELAAFCARGMSGRG